MPTPDQEGRIQSFFATDTDTMADSESSSDSGSESDLELEPLLIGSDKACSFLQHFDNTVFHWYTSTMVHLNLFRLEGIW